MKDMTLASMDETHIDSLLSIETSSFRNPWGKLSFLDEISNQYSLTYVITTPHENGNQVVAYLCLRQIIDELHILKIAVKQTYRRKGIAYVFLSDCLNAISKKKIRTVFLEVRPSNAAGLNLYRKLGFHVIGKRPKYYADTGEDAIIMRKLL
jgi:[ribosomal protein S18]-alanine N-acetyltransferase